MGAGAAIGLLADLKTPEELPYPDLVFLPIFNEDKRYLERWGGVLAGGAKRVTTMATDCHQNTFDDLLPDGEVRRATDDAVALIRADIDGREAEPVGVRMRIDGGDAADADVGAPVASGAFDRVDSQAGHRQSVCQLLGGQAQVDVDAQPFE